MPLLAAIGNCGENQRIELCRVAIRRTSRGLHDVLRNVSEQIVLGNGNVLQGFRLHPTGALGAAGTEDGKIIVWDVDL